MRVLLVVHQYLPHHRAGTEVYTHSLAKHLADRHDVLVYTHEWALDGGCTPAVDDTYDGVSVRRVAAEAGGRARAPWSVFRLDFENPTLLRDLESTLAEFAPDIVHLQHLKGIPAAFLSRVAERGIPMVMTLHDYWLLCPNAQFVRPSGAICRDHRDRHACAECAAGRARWNILMAMRPLVAREMRRRDAVLCPQLRHIARFICPSAFLRQRFVAHGFPEDRLLVMENGLDPARLASVPRPRDGWRGHYAFVGSLAWQKGTHVLIDAFRDLGNAGARLRVWGKVQPDPRYGDRLFRIAGHRPWISLEGEIAEHRIGEALSWADYLIVPSLWWENSPVTIQEAYAAGVPVIASRLGALEEKVRDGVSGLLFEPGDVDDLVRVLRRTIDEPNLLPRLRRGIPPVISIADHAARIEALYAEVIAESKEGGAN